MAVMSAIRDLSTPAKAHDRMIDSAPRLGGWPSPLVTGAMTHEPLLTTSSDGD